MINFQQNKYKQNKNKFSLRLFKIYEQQIYMSEWKLFYVN